ncbi:MAG: uroporphyrinogen-III C-methyltransferase [Myxococcales bacterium]|nr:uroporphyrinogen-III C-methyltransferase [Myxococcales bacterium]
MPVAQKGHVYLVGAGPGSVDLITLRGWSLLQTADVAVVDALADPALFQHLPLHIIDAGKRAGNHGLQQAQIHEKLIELAHQGLAVVRLKGGDPFVLGRGSEEALALAQAGVPCEVVPGVSSALAAPTLAGIALTHRGVAEGFSVVSAHVGDGRPPFGPYHERLTLVVVMGVANREQWLPQLLALGYPPQLPMAWITWAARAEQTVLRTTLGACLSDARSAGLRSPSIAVIGPVAAMGQPAIGQL